jgi:hypothetical protein
MRADLKEFIAGNKLLATELNENFSKVAIFGGNGSDGALDTSGGSIEIDLGGLSYVVKNYTTINIVSNNLSFINPNANGTIIVIKSQGDVIISSTIDASGLGGNGSSGIPSRGTVEHIISSSNGGNGGNSLPSGAGGTATTAIYLRSDIAGKIITATPGAGGGNGGNAFISGTGGAGGKGGGALIIECGGAWNFTGTISVAGNDGENGTTGTGLNGSGGGGGGGGAGGTLVVLYNELTANSGTVNIGGGNGGNGGNGSGSTSGTNSYGGGGGGGGSLVFAGGVGGNYSQNGNNGGGTYGGNGGTAGTNNSNYGGGGGGGGGTGHSYIILNTEF